MKAKYSKATGGIYPVSATKTFPDDVLDIPDALYARFKSAEISRLDVVDGKVVEYVPLAPTTEQLIAAKRAEINAAFEQAMQQITNGYPSNEVSSWAKQEAEARAYQANKAAATPLIDALSAVRGINKADVVARIIAKSDLFATVSGKFIGNRQALEDMLDALPATATPEEIAAITW